MKDISGDIFSFDGKVYNINSTSLNQLIGDQGQYLRLYEVIRVIGSKALFLEDHFDRLVKSIEKKQVHLNIDINIDYVKSEIEKLALKNGQQNFNCMITCFFGQNQNHILIYMRKHSYPSEELYEQGVKVDLLKVKRKDPNVKYVDDNYNIITSEAKSKLGIFEVLLINEENEITEASKSNVFFIKGDVIYTAPSGKVLLGVTRKNVINAIETAGVRLVEEEIPVEILSTFDGIFLTGTSINMLPVSDISNQKFATTENPIFINVSKVYKRILENYLRG